MKPRPALPYTVDDLKQLIGLSHYPPPEVAMPSLHAGILSHYVQGNSRLFFTITDYLLMQYTYVFRNVETLLGYPADVVKTGGPEFIFGLLHPDEMESIKQIHQKIISFYSALPAAHKLTYVYLYDVRLKRANGKYVRLLCEHNCLEVDTRQQPLMTMDTYTEITAFDHNVYQTLVIQHLKKDCNSPDIVEHFFVNDKKNKLTRREMEILQLVKEGYKSKEIGDKLNISKNTVDTHRRKIQNKKRERKALNHAKKN